ncbi:MAG: mannitol-1-phosphate 5-dehydrogenase [Pseudomonadota bacterium]
MKTKILFMGAGAIGRGYLPWTLSASKHEYIFIDSNQSIVDHLNTHGCYTTYRVNGDQYEEMQVKVSAAFTPATFKLEEYNDAVACFFSVGPRNVGKAAQAFLGSDIPLIMCENEPETVAIAKQVVGHNSVYFAVPDVITSNTAPHDLLAQDPLAITSENGILYIEAGPKGLHGEMVLIPREDLLRIQWTPKLYLHNTPHCIAAYLGALMGATYVHEAMMHPQAARLVEGAMTEMLQALKLQWDIPHDFLEWYAKKELARFRCKLLFDPVARVAREPLRKLELHGRLIGAAQMCLTLGVLPQHLLKGIVGAVLFEDVNDPDHHIGLMKEAMDTASFNRYVLGLRPGEPLDLMLREKIGSITTELREITKDAM